MLNVRAVEFKVQGLCYQIIFLCSQWFKLQALHSSQTTSNNYYVPITIHWIGERSPGICSNESQ